MLNTYSFVGGTQGTWTVTRMGAVRGDVLEPARKLEIVGDSQGAPPPGAAWALRGFTSNIRYATRAELNALQAVQPALDRAGASCAALIPIRKSQQWWDMPQDERRAIFEESSQHTKIGMDFLPTVARRLHHCRDLAEPFDFLTWFEYEPRHADAFERLVALLRATPEWTFVEREIDIRLVRD